MKIRLHASDLKKVLQFQFSRVILVKSHILENIVIDSLFTALIVCLVYRVFRAQWRKLVLYPI